MSLLQFLPTQHQFSACLVVELRGDVQTFGLGERKIGHQFLSAVRQIVGFLQARKFAALYFFPCRFLLADDPQHIEMVLTCQFGNFDTTSSFVVCKDHGVGCAKGSTFC